MFSSYLSKCVDPIVRALPEKIKETALVRVFGLLSVPMLFFVSPSVVEMSEERCVVKLPLTRKTKNHLNSMYFGALAVGADCAGGLLAVRFIHEKGNQVSFIFKDFQANFLKRPEGDVLFTCVQGKEIKKLVEKTIASGERENLPVHVVATVPTHFGEEPVAKFTLTLSLKLTKNIQKNKTKAQAKKV